MVNHRITKQLIINRNNLKRQALNCCFYKNDHELNMTGNNWNDWK